MPVRPFALLSHVLPPAWSGQATVLGRLLAELPAARALQVASAPAARQATLPAGVLRLPPPQSFHRLLHAARLPGWHYRLEIAARQRQVDLLTALLRPTGVRALVACTGSLLDPVVGAAAAAALGIDYYLYVFDPYAEQWVHPVARRAAQAWEPDVVRQARAVIVTNPVLGDWYRARYGITPTVIFNSVDCHAYRAPLPARLPGPWRLVYTGAVYQAQADALLNVQAAIATLPADQFELHLYTAQPVAALQHMGFTARTRVHAHVPPAEVPAVHRAADILLLPLAFTTPYPASLILTAAPGKTGEYLASGRPLLVHAPAGSFIASYVQQHACGVVVTTRTPAAVAAALQQMVADQAAAAAMGTRAQARAAEDFDLTVARSRFVATLGEE